MEETLWFLLKVLAVGVLVFLNGFFVAAEFALVKVRETQLTGMVAAGNRRALMARRLIGNLDSYLSACQLGITLASLGLGWIGEPIFEALLTPLYDLHLSGGDPWLAAKSHWRNWISFGVGFTVITFLHITAGEQAPKWMAIKKPLPTSLWTAYPLRWFYILMYPFIHGLNRCALWMLRSVGLETKNDEGHDYSEEELRMMVCAARAGKGSEAFGRDVVLNAFDLRHRVAREVMQPRRNIEGFDSEAPIADCLTLAEQTRHSRFPLCEGGDLDRTLGVVHIKDLYAQRHTAKTGADLLPFARKLIYAPEAARLEGLLRIFLDRKLHFALVVNEYGETEGMLTLENILEELVGQIQDEFDHEAPQFEEINETTWSVRGTLPLHELAELTGEPCDEKGVTTVSGLITRRLGTFPKVGDVLELGRFELRVEQTYRLQVERARLVKLSDRAPSDGETKN